MEILIYDQNLFREGIIENHSSLIWVRKYFEPGNFELHVPLTDQNISLLKNGNIIAKRNTVEAGIIEDLEIDESKENKEIIVKGRFISSYMDRRLIKGTFNFSGKTEIAMRELLMNVTKIPLVELGDLKDYKELITFQATMKNLLNTQIKLAKSSGIGFRIYPDFVNKKLIFDVYCGTNHSINQFDNNHVIFSDDYDNLNRAIYRCNDQLSKTLAIVGGEGEGSSRIYVTVGSGEGLYLREVFVDAKDIQSEELTNDEYINALTQRGVDELSSKLVSESFESEIESNANFIYKEDYDLGDIVTVRKKSWGIELNQRITEIQEIYENGGMSVIPTFGDALPETVDWSN